MFSNEVDTQKSPLTDFAPGEEATLCDARGASLGSVCLNPASLICARLHARQAETPLDAVLLRQRLSQALNLRQRLFPAPWYRLCHGEGDFLPGLVIDRYGRHCTLQLSTAGMESRKELIAQCLDDLIAPASLLFDNDLAMRGLEGLSRESQSRGELPQRLEVPENGCRFFAPCATGQKTGWFYDQRLNRRELARYACDADVLDIFCYAGGFGVTAAAAGAKSVTFLDASPQALALALKPSEAASVCAMDMRQAEEYLKGAVFEGTGEKGWRLMLAEGHSLGWGKEAGGMVKNHYPKGLRRN